MKRMAYHLLAILILGDGSIGCQSTDFVNSFCYAD